MGIFPSESHALLCSPTFQVGHHVTSVLSGSGNPIKYKLAKDTKRIWRSILRKWNHIAWWDLIGSDRGKAVCAEALCLFATLQAWDLTLWSQAKRLQTFYPTISTFSVLLPLHWSIANHFRGTWRAYFVEEQMWNSFPRVVAAAVASCCSSNHLWKRFK